MACQDPSLTLLKQFGYNVLRLPRPDAAPLDLLSRSGKELARLGPIRDVFKPGAVPPPKINRAQAGVKISGQKTGKLDTSLGVTLLSTFISALGGNAGVKASYRRAHQIAFTYEEVIEESIDITKLDAFLSAAAVRENLFTINRLLESDDVYIFTSVLKTNKLGVEAYTSSGQAIELDVPVIQQAAGGQLKVSGEKKNDAKILFEGNVPVAFGFQAVRLFYQDGHFRMKTAEPGSVAARALPGKRGARKPAALAPEQFVADAPLLTITDVLSSPEETDQETLSERNAVSIEALSLEAPQPISIHPPQLHLSRSLAIAEGAAPEVQTIIYVHGIGNKPTASVLKCQWDRALFGSELGDRSRMAYWVNRDYYPVPLDETCAGQDHVRIDDDEASTQAIMALSGVRPVHDREAIDREIRAFTANPVNQQFLSGLARKMLIQSETRGLSAPTGPYQARILPLPRFLRELITRKITRAFLRDVNDFLFHPKRRALMERSLTDRLNAGGGPFVVIAHSQGSMVAYQVLRQLRKEQCDVRLFLTIGSPLGLTEVKDILRKWGPKGALEKPACVDQWVNVADKLDPVSADSDLSNDYEGGVINYDAWSLNPDSPRHPHSATGYLRSAPVKKVIQETVGNAFGQSVGRAIIAKDLVREMEDCQFEERRPVLIQLSTEDNSTLTLDEARAQLVDTITKLARSETQDIEDSTLDIDCTKRFVAAQLTRREVETLRTQFEGLKIERVWRNAAKRALIYASTHTIQARPGNTGYGATGQNIGWAVLDTGIRADHPHFQLHANVVQQWDCTKNQEPQLASPAQSAELDKHGHGTHVAGIIAGEFRIPHEPGKAEIHFAGMAPQTKLYGFKVLDDQGNGRDSWIIKALDKVAQINESAGRLVIQGVNLSLGGNFDPSVYGCGHTPLCQELRRLWQQGVLICLAAGNEGYALLQSVDGELPSNLDLSIGDPANLDEAIAVGSIHKSNPHTYGVSYFSSRGPTADGRRKPDVVAPGEEILSAYHDWKRNPQVASDLYIQMSGTSMAAPHIAGILAAFLSMRREFIGYPDRVKQLMIENCTDLARDPYIQGWGMPNLVKMLVNS